MPGGFQFSLTPGGLQLTLKLCGFHLSLMLDFLQLSLKYCGLQVSITLGGLQLRDMTLGVQLCLTFGGFQLILMPGGMQLSLNVPDSLFLGFCPLPGLVFGLTLATLTFCGHLLAQKNLLQKFEKIHFF
ncbi:hypothetical protein OTU49_014871, partial [Cherax quadricarinatus]